MTNRRFGLATLAVFVLVFLTPGLVLVAAASLGLSSRMTLIALLGALALLIALWVPILAGFTRSRSGRRFAPSRHQPKQTGKPRERSER
jgi:hypothetical protein